jgi:Tol biopolymer transport system component
MIKTTYSFLLICLIFTSCTQKADQAFDWVKPSDNLQMLGEGTLSRSSADIYNFAFTTEGDTIFFHTTDKGDGKAGVAISTRTESGWTQPEPAPFETENYDEGHVSMSPDGKHLVFSSDRTDDLKGEPKPADEFFVVSQSSGWTNAKRLTSTSRMSEKRGTLASDGTFYYWAYQRGTGMYFFKSQIDKNLSFAEPQDAGKMLFENYKGENNPYIHPNKNYMLFAVYGKDDGYGKEDIYISRRENNSWTSPINLGNLINTNGNDTSPYVSTDGRYLFFVSDRLTSKTDTLDNRNLYMIKTSQLELFNQS